MKLGCELSYKKCVEPSSGTGAGFATPDGPVGCKRFSHVWWQASHHGELHFVKIATGWLPAWVQMPPLQSALTQWKTCHGCVVGQQYAAAIEILIMTIDSATCRQFQRHGAFST